MGDIFEKGRTQLISEILARQSWSQKLRRFFIKFSLFFVRPKKKQQLLNTMVLEVVELGLQTNKIDIEQYDYLMKQLENGRLIYVLNYLFDSVEMAERLRGADIK